MRRATSLLTRFHKSMTRGFAQSKKALPHFNARCPAVFTKSTARSNQGNNGLSGGIFARTQATQSLMICETARHNTPHGSSTGACSIASRKRANSAAISALLRRSSSSWRESSLACAASCSARCSLSSAFLALCRASSRSAAISRVRTRLLEAPWPRIEKAGCRAARSHRAGARVILRAPVFRAQRRRRPWECDCRTTSPPSNSLANHTAATCESKTSRCDQSC